MSGRRRLLLIRHGQADDVAGRCIGRTDVTLSADGARTITQLAHRLAALLASNENIRIVSSDRRRAADSAAILGATLGQSVEYDVRLREMDFGEWDGLAWTEIERRDPARYSAWLSDWLRLSAPAGETVDDLLRRARDWIDSLPVPTTRPETIAVVSHAGWIRAVVTLLLKRRPDDMFDIRVDHATVTVVELNAGEWIVSDP